MLLNITFQDASPLINYSSGWFVGGSGNQDPFASQYDGSFTPTSIAGAHATINFVGNSVSLFGALRDNHGNYTVNLDQNAPFTASGLSPVNTFQKPLFVATGLDYTSHQLTITNVPTSVNDTWLDLDFVTIGRQIGNPSDQVVQLTLDDSDTSSSIVYTPGSWSPVSSTSAFQFTLHQTTVAQAQVTILFQGCCIEVYGQYANAQYTVTLDNKAPVPFQGLDFDLTAQQQQNHAKTLLYLMDGLTEDSHNVTLTNTNANPNRPFFFDYAIVSSTKNFSNTTGSGTGGSGNTTTMGNGNIPAVNSKSHTTVAPIVGGTIGGLLVLAILAIVAFFVRRRRRRPADSLTPEDPEDPEHMPQPYFVTNRVSMNGVDAHIPNVSSNSHTRAYSATPFVPDSKRPPLPPSSTTSDLAGPRIHHTTVSSEDKLQTAALGGGVTGSHAHTVSSASEYNAISSHVAYSSTSLPPSQPGDSSSRQVVQAIARTTQEADAGVVVNGSDTPPANILPPAYSPFHHYKD